MKIYYYIMANMFYYLGDFASKPMQWDWMNGESAFIERLCGINYRIYNWLMMTSTRLDKYEDVWVNSTEDEIEPEDDHFTLKTFIKPTDKEE